MSKETGGASTQATNTITKKVFNYGIQNADGSVTDAEMITYEGILQVWEDVIKYKRIGSELRCTLTDQEELVDYKVEITPAHNGNSWRAYCTKKSRPGHWIDLFVVPNYRNVPFFAEPYDASDDPTFEYGPITEAIEQYFTNNFETISK